MELTGAEILIEGLRSAGVKVVFGVSGTTILPTLDVLRRAPDIRYIQAQHEQAAMYMANGYARQAREAGVCLVSPGPGETNCYSGVAQALYTSTPSILIGVEENSWCLGLGPSIHHDLDSPRVFAPVTKLAVRVDSADRLQEHLRRAFVTALADRKGPCFVGIPEDLQKTKVTVASPGLSVHRPQPTPGNPQDIESVASLLEQAQRPIVLAGGGVNWAGAYEEILQLAELVQMPVGGSRGHAGIIPADHPLSVGTIGPGGPPPALQALKEADLVLAIGCAFTYFVGTGARVAMPKNARIVHIDTDPTEIGKVFPVAASVVGDARLVLRDLLALLKDRGRLERRGQELGWVQHLARRKVEWADYLRPLQSSDKVPIQSYRLMADLRKALPRDAVVGAESGATRMWFDNAFQEYAPNTFGGWHPLGAELCEAMGVKVASPQTPVVCLMGDGSAMMSLQEWATAVANNIPILCVVTHNGVFGNMRHTQITQYDSQFIGTELPIPNLTNIAREFGAYAERVELPNEIIPAVTRALASGRPALLEFMMDASNDSLVPPTLEYLSTRE